MICDVDSPFGIGWMLFMFTTAHDDYPQVIKTHKQVNKNKRIVCYRQLGEPTNTKQKSNREGKAPSS